MLVAFIIYEFLSLIKGTRAALMLVGVAALGLAFYVARLGELATLNWLVGTLLPYSVFALIVVFAVEIRQALARLGRKLALSRSLSSEADAYDDIVLAANLFCQNQTGALIVIEREIGLRTYVESGVPLDAQLSYDLLATIFRPSAPLHDGAVIVQKDRIAAAACFLPLSITTFMNLASISLLYFGSGRMVRTGAWARRDINAYPYFFGRLAPYFERPCLRSPTPAQSSVPRTV